MDDVTVRGAGSEPRGDQSKNRVPAPGWVRIAILAIVATRILWWGVELVGGGNFADPTRTLFDAVSFAAAVLFVSLRPGESWGVAGWTGSVIAGAFIIVALVNPGWRWLNVAVGAAAVVYIALVGLLRALAKAWTVKRVSATKFEVERVGPSVLRVCGLLALGGLEIAGVIVAFAAIRDPWALAALAAVAIPVAVGFASVLLEQRDPLGLLRWAVWLTPATAPTFIAVYLPAVLYPGHLWLLVLVPLAVAVGTVMSQILCDIYPRRVVLAWMSVLSGALFLVAALLTEVFRLGGLIALVAAAATCPTNSPMTAIVGERSRAVLGEEQDEEQKRGHQEQEQGHQEQEQGHQEQERDQDQTDVKLTVDEKARMVGAVFFAGLLLFAMAVRAGTATVSELHGVPWALGLAGVLALAAAPVMWRLVPTERPEETANGDAPTLALRERLRVYWVELIVTLRVTEFLKAVALISAVNAVVLLAWDAFFPQLLADEGFFAYVGIVGLIYPFAALAPIALVWLRVAPQRMLIWGMTFNILAWVTVMPLSALGVRTLADDVIANLLLEFGTTICTVMTVLVAQELVKTQGRIDEATAAAWVAKSLGSAAGVVVGYVGYGLIPHRPWFGVSLLATAVAVVGLACAAYLARNIRRSGSR